ncbi:protein GDAP2 homolog [Gigantopelta aegis]|uniref:protein GDAP2 homolog n=1 Tax=Gigantopelta aegis TaxID=1735272 RepID=UPI001B88E52B|nr:protein GDAP2 homolog [Gigantopelta aegis]
MSTGLKTTEDMDPLGARSDVIEVEKLTRWNLTQLPEYHETEQRQDGKTVPFPWRNDLNAKIILWGGDITCLNVHAIVHTTNEHLTDQNPQSDLIFEKAGPALQVEVKNSIKVCKTGEAKITKGHNLLARYVIHTVGPRYNIKYLTAAESALFCSYRSTLQLAREYGIRTLGLCCIHTTRRGYPPESGAHIAIRTTRRFLEKYGGSFDTIVFVCAEETLDIYRRILPLYFPRNNKEEDFAIDHLPNDLGNEDGEPVIEERQIRIIDKPTFAALRANHDDLEETIDLNQEFCPSTVLDVGHHPFSHMEENPDNSRHAGVTKNNTEQKKLDSRRRYERFLKRAKSEDLTDIAGLRCLYRTGTDRCGRPVVVFIGKQFIVDAVDPERALLYLVRVMEPVVDKDYVVVYFHTQTTKRNQPPMNYLKMAYNLLDNRYKKNLKYFYIIHPTWWSKLATWFFTTFTASDIKPNVHNLKGVQYLYSKMDPDQIDVPPFVMDYDTQINGPRYHVPPEDSSDGL